MRNILDFGADLITGGVVYLLDLWLVEAVAINVDQYPGGIGLNSHKGIDLNLFNLDGINCMDGSWRTPML